MKKYSILLILIFLISTSLFAQEMEGKQKLTKEQRKELRKQKTLENKQKIIDLLNSQQWIIEANTVYDRYNQSYQLNPTINFVGVDNKDAALQLGFDGVVGWNGVGGVTIDGTVTSYKVNEGKGNSSPSVSLRFSGRGTGSANIHVTVNSSGNATARVNGDFGSRITFQGQLVPVSESVVYKGQSLF